ncbi:hypothetical protein H4S04_004262 [Coemansia sp. S16]|nr:hypothetical protein H4S04_004262 [Coemansia sp. S16]
MYAPTPFQFLPPHIVQLIVKYIVGNTRMRFNKDRGDLRRHEELLVPLQWVCHNFRNFVHFRFFSECELFLPFSHAEISDTESSDAEASDAEASDAEASEAGVSEADVIWPLSPRWPKYPTHHLVKTLSIYMHAWEAYSGEALRMLSVPPFDGVAFPLVSKLTIVLCYSGRRKGYKGDNGGFPDYTLYNIRDFVGRVAEMATGIGEVFIDMQDETTDGDHEGVYYFNDLFSQLYEIGNMTVLNDPCCKMAPHIDLDFIEDLVRLTCNVDYLSVQLLPLARLSAQTLEYLDIRSYHGADITGFIRDPGSGEYSEYPRLRTLKIEATKRYQCYKRLVFDGAMPFPRLRQLYIESLYPFGDYVFFRGNAATLEYLGLSPCRDTVAVLNKHNVFIPVSHPQLQRVDITRPSDYSSYRFATAVAYLEFVMSIAPGASVRQIYKVDSYSKDITLALSVLGNYTCIQVLSLPHATLSLWDAITLIRSLPLLSDLGTGTLGLGELPRDVSMASLPEYVRSNYAPMGKRFRCWHTCYCCENDVTEIVTVVLLLALACPNFDYAALDEDHEREQFMEAMQEKIIEPGFSQDAPRLRLDSRRRQQQSALVTITAERHFDSILGQCNWEAVTGELDTLLMECLDLFDVSNLKIQPRSLIETYGGWSKPDVEKLKLFMTTKYADCSTIDWRLVGIYMNVDALECQRIGLGTFNYPINEVSYRRIREFRDSGLGWKDVHQHFMQYPNEKSLQGRYYRFKVKPNGKTTKGLTTEGTDADADLERMKDLIEKHLESTARSELLKAGRMNLDQLTQLRELVAEYGEDWDHIGKVLDVLPSMARYNWITYGGNVGNRFALSSDEARQLQHLVDSGVKYKEAAKLLGIVSPHGCDTHLKSNCTSTEDETLLKMIDVSMTSTAAKWELVSKVLGRSVIACKQRLSVINRGHKCEQVDYDRESIVTSEVQRQLESNRTVNWSKVSQATELGLRECLELSQYDDGKASWHYDPDSFSQGMADRMTNFIKEHYPAPVPVIYRAVSNFMWVAMDDCICIHDMLQGKFKWTEADYERATALRAKGLA